MPSRGQRASVRIFATITARTQSQCHLALMQRQCLFEMSGSREVPRKPCRMVSHTDRLATAGVRRNRIGGPLWRTTGSGSTWSTACSAEGTRPGLPVCRRAHDYPSLWRRRPAAPSAALTRSATPGSILTARRRGGVVSRRSAGASPRLAAEQPVHHLRIDRDHRQNEDARCRPTAVASQAARPMVKAGKMM
jgi:hypothetical protein